MDLLRGFAGSDRVLARHAGALPQPDQLCGPWAAHVALHALDDAAVPAVADLAVASGSAVFPSDVAEWRPPGTTINTTGWAVLPHVSTPEGSGTTALGLAAGLEAVAGVSVVPARDAPVGALPRLLLDLLDGPPVGVLANVRTGALDPGAAFDVGHFLVVWGCSDDGRTVGLADSYPEVGDPDQPAGCRVVTTDALQRGLDAPPGRGLLLLARPADAPTVRALVTASGATSTLWST